MPLKWLLLSYARKKPAKAGFAACGGILVKKILFGGFIEFLKKKLQDTLGFGSVFFLHQRLKLLYSLLQV